MDRVVTPASERERRTQTEQFLQLLCNPVFRYIDHPVAIICAHPDDETIGAGSRLPRLRNVAVLHVTDGAPAVMNDALRNGFDSRKAYAAARRAELEAALALGGVKGHQLHECGIPDQEAALMMSVATRAVLEFLERFTPEVIITHPYEGGHPDHDSTAFAVHAACSLLGGSHSQVPTIVEMTSYHNVDGSMATGGFIERVPAIPVMAAPLTADERELKQKMFASFHTQAPVIAQFPIDTERFRPAPRYDFARAPHPGTLFYELHPWGMTSERFLASVADSLSELGLTESTL